MTIDIGTILHWHCGTHLQRHRADRPVATESRDIRMASPDGDPQFNDAPPYYPEPDTRTNTMPQLRAIPGSDRAHPGGHGADHGQQGTNSSWSASISSLTRAPPLRRGERTDPRATLKAAREAGACGRPHPADRVCGGERAARWSRWTSRGGLVKLGGSAAALARAFGAESASGAVRSGRHLPRPHGRAAPARSAGGTGDRGVGVRYAPGGDPQDRAAPGGAAAAGVPADADRGAVRLRGRAGGRIECIGIIELGGGYTDADNAAAFAAMRAAGPADRRDRRRRSREQPRRHQRRERRGRP